MKQQTTARILATEIENEAALEANEAIQGTLNNAAAELRRLEAENERLKALAQPTHITWDAMGTRLVNGVADKQPAQQGESVAWPTTCATSMSQK